MSRAARPVSDVIASQRSDQIAAALADARGRNKLGVFIGRAELYCENPACPLREITIVIKEFDGKLGGGLCCPNCLRQLKPHHVLTLEEHDYDEERMARVSVRAQLYARRHGPSIPLGMLLDDSLPRPEEL